jgi:glutamyl-tRNA synthetase
MHGRFAPSPTGPLHVGNLRTALVAWLSARTGGSGFTVRMEDLDRVTSSRTTEALQLAELEAIGLDWDGEVVRQSDRFARYEDALAELESQGLIYECFCTRREIREAAAAPHGALSRYPGTCRRLDPDDRAERRRAGRQPALRVAAGGARVTVVDRLAGAVSAAVDDVVVRRTDGVPAYNLAVVVDDAAQGVQEVVRGDDLLGVSPSQVWLQRRLGIAEPGYVHVPLVVGPTGQRLAKRDGAVTIEDLAAQGIGTGELLGALAASLGLSPAGRSVTTAADLLGSFDWDRVPRRPCSLHDLLP